jgi:hypothetical protein
MSIVSTFSAAGSRALGHIGHLDQNRGFDDTRIPIVYYTAHYDPRMSIYNFNTNTHESFYWFSDDGSFYAEGGRTSILIAPNKQIYIVSSASSSNASKYDTAWLDTDDTMERTRNHYSNFNGYGEQRTAVTWNPNYEQAIYHVSPHYNTNTLGFTMRIEEGGASITHRTPDGGTGSASPWHYGGCSGMALLKDTDSMGNTSSGDEILMIGKQAYGLSEDGKLYVDDDFTYADNANNFYRTPNSTASTSSSPPYNAMSGRQDASYDSVAPYSKTKAVMSVSNYDSEYTTWYYDTTTSLTAPAHSSVNSIVSNDYWRRVFPMATGVWGAYSFKAIKVFKGGLSAAPDWDTDLTSALSIGSTSSDYRVMMVIGTGDHLYVLRKLQGGSYTTKMDKIIFNLGTGTYTMSTNTITGEIAGNSFDQYDTILQYYTT